MVVNHNSIRTIGSELTYYSLQRLLLSIKANLENVTNLVPATDDFEYFFGVRGPPILSLCSVPTSLTPDLYR
jgi:hypothetical protein